MSLKGDIALIQDHGCTQVPRAACDAALTRVEVVAVEMERLLAKFPRLIRELHDSPKSLYAHLEDGLPHIEAVLALAREPRPGMLVDPPSHTKCEAHGCRKAARWLGPADNEGVEVLVSACDDHRQEGDEALKGPHGP